MYKNVKYICFLVLLFNFYLRRVGLWNLDKGLCKRDVFVEKMYKIFGYVVEMDLS